MRKASIASSTTCSSDPERILVILPNWLGDAVMATPLLEALRAALPASRVRGVCRRYVGGLLRAHPALDELVEYDPRGGHDALIRAARGERPPGGFAACFVLPRSFASALAAFLSRSRRRIGYGGEWRGFLLTDRLAGSRYRAEHLSTVYVRLLERFTGAAVPSVPLPSLAPPPGWEGTVGRLVPGGGYVVLAPGATYGSSKVWPIDRFADTARLFAEERGWRVAIVGNAAERETAGRILERAAAPGTNLAGGCDVPELVAVLRGARLVIGNDSGPVHVAAALGVPTVAIFGSTSVTWTAPRGRAVRVVRENLPCSPCFERKCPDGDPRCMSAVPTERVAAAARELLGKESHEIH